MIIDCISDLHGFKPKLEGGDLLIVAGDLTGRDTPPEYLAFNSWLSKQDYRRKIVIAGNHDGLIESGVPIEVLKDVVHLVVPVLADKAVYLCDKEHIFEGLKIWGSPWTPTFLNWHFMKNRGAEIQEKWDLIPEDTDILVTHGPPFGVQDTVKYSSKAKDKGSAGCEMLRDVILKIKPKLHVFGHVHESYGQVLFNDIICVNASIMNEEYQPVNKPIRIVL